MKTAIARYVGKVDPVVDAAIIAAAGRQPDETKFAHPSGPGGKLACVTIHSFVGPDAEDINSALKPILGVEAFLE
jgi:hypothetical protein